MLPIAAYEVLFTPDSALQGLSGVTGVMLVLQYRVTGHLWGVGKAVTRWAGGRNRHFGGHFSHLRPIYLRLRPVWGA